MVVKLHLWKTMSDGSERAWERFDGTDDQQDHDDMDGPHAYQHAPNEGATWKLLNSEGYQNFPEHRGSFIIVHVMPEGDETVCTFGVRLTQDGHTFEDESGDGSLKDKMDIIVEGNFGITRIADLL